MYMPLLAPSETLTPKTAAKLVYPVIISPKFDGIRATRQDTGIFSRTAKPLPNDMMRQYLQSVGMSDGELVCGSPTMDGGFNYTQSVVMGNNEVEDWTYWVFDVLDFGTTYERRLETVHKLVSRAHAEGLTKVKEVPTFWAKDVDELLALEHRFRTEEWEGVMVRRPDGLYPKKEEGENRCTALSRLLLKYKKFEDSEGQIVGIYQGQTNTNPAFKDERGKTKRSTAKAGMVPNGHCGGFQVYDAKFGWTCDVAPGKFTAAQLKDIWENQQKYIGRTLKYKFQLKGQMTLPRFPTAQGFRDQGE
jgi:DNA ligase 1